MFHQRPPSVQPAVIEYSYFLPVNLTSITRCYFAVQYLSRYQANASWSAIETFWDRMVARMATRDGGVSVWWQGGVWATQYLECRESLLDSKEPWLAIFTNPPPTTVTTNVLDMGATDEVLFYRIRAERP